MPDVFAGDSGVEGLTGMGQGVQSTAGRAS